MRVKKVLGKGLSSLYIENQKESIKGLIFTKKGKKQNLCINENKVDKYHIINR